jgi:SulP family sulfate permease
MASSVDVLPVSDVQLAEGSTTNGRPHTLPDGVLVYSIEGPFFFAAVDAFERALAQTHTDPKVLVIRLNRVPFIDITGLQAIEEVIDDINGRGVSVLLCEANARVTTKLTRAGITGTGTTRLFDTLGDALDVAGDLTDDPAPGRDAA